MLYLKNTHSLLAHFIQLPQLICTTEEFEYDSFLLKAIPCKNANLILPDTMLGKQAEALFEQVINTSETYDIITANIQIQGVSETLGELDYIVKDTLNKQLIHVELACKFYLFDERIEGPSTAKWVGPNRKDTLEDKLHKLKQKQFPLLYQEETKDILKKLGLQVSEVQQQVCLQAQLFIPKGKEKSDYPSSYQKCIVGRWMPYIDFLSEDKKARYYLPSKREWLLPAAEVKLWHTFEETKGVLTDLVNEKCSPFVYKKIGDTIERFFVVWW